MDLVAACRIFVHVAERSSFTDGAAAARVPQPVASRRVAALEAHLGQRLFDRTTRRTGLTPFGAELVGSARRLVQLADAFELDAERARLRPLTLALPETAAPRAVARLAVAAVEAGTAIEAVLAGPRRREELLRSRQVRAALLAVPAASASWATTLGMAGREVPAAPLARLSALRPSRHERAQRRLLLQPEDDVPHLRDEAQRAGNGAGLAPTQVAVAPSLIAATADVLRRDDLLLCSRPEADELGLGWRPLREPALVRGHAVAAADRDEAAVLTGALTDAVARALGADAAGGTEP